eukprot:2714867-Amphidinium_carterae.1
MKQPLPSPNNEYHCRPQPQCTKEVHGVSDSLNVSLLLWFPMVWKCLGAFYPETPCTTTVVPGSASFAQLPWLAHGLLSLH